MNNPANEPARIPGWRHVSSGKVRDLYLPEGPALAADGAVATPGEPAPLLLVASDRISAFDHVLSTPIPDKGIILTRLSRWWFAHLADVVPNHLHPQEQRYLQALPAQVAARSMVVQSLQMVPVEAVARGYLTGSGWVEYQDGGTVAGQPLPPGLLDGSRLEVPLFTPARKADLGEHDENITFAQAQEQVGQETAAALRELTLRLYSRAREMAAQQGIILADTKFEFGFTGAGELVVADEVLTPDSSRYWPADSWRPGQAQPSYDKQFVRDWLTSEESGWDRAGEAPPPALPAEVVRLTRQRYLSAYEALTGQQFAAHLPDPPAASAH